MIVVKTDLKNKIDLEDMAYTIETKIQNNDLKYNISKVAEELNELAAELLKVHNKQDTLNPEDPFVIEELIDCQIRLNWLISYMHLPALEKYRELKIKKYYDLLQKLGDKINL